MMYQTYKKKLIEVSLPIEAINQACVREKSIRHGHPSTLHLWWSRKPLAVCRAVLFASLVDDPSADPERFPTEEAQEEERKRLFKLIKRLVQWENLNDSSILEEAHAEMSRSTNHQLPQCLDPFAGGGSIPLEALRLGLEAHAADLNPVAVLLNKALIEIPPKFRGCSPINPLDRSSIHSSWQGARGLASDIRYYGRWMRDEAEKRIGYLYPKAYLEDGSEATIIAWLWVRTVTCPNPACQAQMPLTNKWWLSKKQGKETWVVPIVNRTIAPPTLYFEIHRGKGEPQDGTVNRHGATCIACHTPVSFNHIRDSGKAGHMGTQLIAIVAEGRNGRAYLPPCDMQIEVAAQAKPNGLPEAKLPYNPRDFKTPNYGLYTFSDLFTSRQLVALTTFSDLIQETHSRILAEASAANVVDDGKTLNDGGVSITAYADAIVTYLAIALDKGVDYWSALCSWHNGRDTIGHTFTKQALPMIWDFAEANPFSDSSGNFLGAVSWVAEAVENTPLHVFKNAEGKDTEPVGYALQRDAVTFVNGVDHPLISMDPPYYDNIGYGDLSDFFYIWLRRSLSLIYPDLFETMLVPKEQELVATPYRFGGDKKKAQEFFENGLRQAFKRMDEVQYKIGSNRQEVDYPLTIYYAFKQADEDSDEPEPSKSRKKKGTGDIASTGWEAMLESLISAGFTITGTWPVRTELVNRSIGQGTNALASSIVLVCRPRPNEAPIASRREFLAALRADLPDALRKLQQGGIAPVDLAQASIGPGMEVYSRYRKVIESDGMALNVRTALQLINRTLDEVLGEPENEYDPETRWTLAWFEEYAMNPGDYGRAETLSKAKNVSLSRLGTPDGLLEMKSGKVRLLTREELAQRRSSLSRTPSVWEVMQLMIQALQEGRGESGAGEVFHTFSEQAESARDLAYRLHLICERKNWSQEALAYNSLVTAWSKISSSAHKQASQEAREVSLWKIDDELQVRD